MNSSISDGLCQSKKRLIAPPEFPSWYISTIGFPKILLIWAYFTLQVGTNTFLYSKQELFSITKKELRIIKFYTFPYLHRRKDQFEYWIKCSVSDSFLLYYSWNWIFIDGNEIMWTHSMFSINFIVLDGREKEVSGWRLN